MSHMTTIRLLETLGENHDAKVYEWQKSLLAHLETIQVIIFHTMQPIYIIVTIQCLKLL